MLLKVTSKKVTRERDEKRWLVGVPSVVEMPATLSNCGNPLKLRLPSRGGNTRGGQGNDLGYGKNV
jgi:hypothetical protein